jgi:HlyD family secretion protein
MVTKFLLPLAAIGLLIFAVMFVRESRTEMPPVVPVSAPPRNPFLYGIAGGGVIEPQTENISIGSAVSGVVVEVLVRVGQRVKQGEILFRLDDRQLQADLRYREAALAASQAELTRLENQPRPEELPINEAEVAQAEADLADQSDQLRRKREMFARKVISAEELNTREQAYRKSQAQLAKAKAQFDLLKAGAWQFDKTVARAAVGQAQSQVNQIRTDIDRLCVRAQVDGQVLQVNVRPGEFVATPASQALVVLGNIEMMHARVDIDEYDIPRFNPGDRAVAMLKGRTDQQFPLKFVRVEPYVIPKRSLTGDNTERVDTRVLQVIYSIDSRDKQLYVGQQLDVFVDTGRDKSRQREEPPQSSQPEAKPPSNPDRGA